MLSIVLADDFSWFGQTLWVLGIVTLMLVLGIGSVFTVRQQHAGIVERWGKFHRVARAGLHYKYPVVDRVVGAVDMRVRALTVDIETKTKDNVILKILANVQWKVETGKESDWFYAMDNGEKQVGAFVMNVVRAHAPKMALDEVYEKKDELANEIAADLAAEVGKFGFIVQKALIVDVAPDGQVAKARRCS